MAKRKRSGNGTEQTADKSAHTIPHTITVMSSPPPQEVRLTDGTRIKVRVGVCSREMWRSEFAEHGRAFAVRAGNLLVVLVAEDDPNREEAATSTL